MELNFYRFSNLFNFPKVPVVGCHSSGQFPNSFDRIQFRAVRRKKQMREFAWTVLSPFWMEFCMMISGVIGQHQNTTPWVAAYLPKLFHKAPIGLSVKWIGFSLMQQLSIAKPHGTEVSDTFTCWMVQHNRVFAFGRHPHSASGTMLLEVDLIKGPKINVIIGSILSDFF